MLIKALLNAKNCPSVADFRKREERVLKFSYFLFALGLCTLLFAFLGVPSLLKAGAQPEFFQGVYSGIGIAAIGISVVMFVSTRALLHSETKLKAAFIKATDERSAAIDDAAMQAATAVLLGLLYVVLLVVGLFYPILFCFCLACVVTFVVLKLVFKLYFEKKM